MRIKDFPLERFLAFQQEKSKNMSRYISANDFYVPMVQMPAGDQWGYTCRSKEGSLEAQLDFLNAYMSLKTDLAFTYLEPWYGVGLYASAFGCKYEWHKGEAPQTRAIYSSVDEITNIKYPSTSDCEVMQNILEMIKYFKEQTGGALDIALTDTQSPNDTASLIMDSCEFFVTAATEPELLHDFLNKVTNLTIEFSDMQREAIGENFVQPGHIMLSQKGLNGISLSDDNMAILSPGAFKDTCIPYNNILSKHFGGVAIHSCGNFSHNANLLMTTESLTMVDLAAGTVVDPTPNKPATLRATFEKSGVIVKAKVGWNEIEKIEPLVSPDIKLIVHLFTNGSIDEKNRQYEIAQQKLSEMVAKARK